MAWAALMMVTSCGRQEIAVLDGLRSELTEKPDSVLDVLEHIAPIYDVLSGRRLHSEFVLLKSEAQELTYPGIATSDIRELTAATSFLDRWGPADKRISAWHCLGKAQFNACDYRDAIISLSRAEDKSRKKASDPGRTGAILMDMAKTFRATGDYTEEISCLRKAAAAFDEAGKPFSSRNARFECGVASYNAQDLSSAEEIFRTMMHEAHASADTLLEARCLESYAMMNLEQAHPDPVLAINMLSRVANELRSPLSCIDRGILAYAYSLLGDKAEARTWLKKAKASAESGYEVSQTKFREYQIMARSGDYKAALNALESVMDYSDRMDVSRLRESAVSAEKEYLKQENELTEARLRASRMTLLVIVAAALILIFAFISFFRYRSLQNEKKLGEERSETERYMGIAEDLQSRLKAAAKRLPSEKHLSIAKFDMLERLCEQYYIYEGTDNLQPKVLKEVKSIINDLRTDAKTLQGLELMLDRNCGNLVARLREQLPKLKDDDIRLFIYAASGFSSTTISTILEKDKSIVYNRIWRLKGKLDASDAPDKADFLQALEK